MTRDYRYDVIAAVTSLLTAVRFTPSNVLLSFANYSPFKMYLLRSVRAVHSFCSICINLIGVVNYQLLDEKKRTDIASLIAVDILW